MAANQGNKLSTTASSQSTSALSYISHRIDKIEVKVDHTPSKIAENERIVKETVAKWIEGVKSGVSAVKEQIHKIFIS